MTAPPELMRRLTESFGTMSPWGWPMLWQAYQYSNFPGPGGFPYRGASGTVTDRAYGKDLPFFWSEVDLRGYRVTSRFLAETNPFAIGFCTLLVGYHVRKGYGWQCCRKGAKKTPYPTLSTNDELVAKGQRILDQFRDKNLWPVMSREAFYRWRVDGETFVRLGCVGPGEIAWARFVEPEQVGAPDGATNEPWSYGIDVKEYPDGRIDPLHPLAYHVWDLESGMMEGQWVDARYVVHAKANVASTVKRGRPDFFPLLDTFDNVKQLVNNMLVSAVRQAAIAWLEKFPNSTMQQVVGAVPERAVAGQGVPITGPGQNWPGWPYPFPSHANSIPPGSIYRTEGTREITPNPGSPASAGWIEVEKLALRAARMRWNLPGSASGDAEDTTFAAAIQAGGPFPVAVEGSQLEWGACFERPVALKALDLAVDAGLLTAAERAQLDVEVTEPAVVTPEPDKDTQRRQTLNAAKVLSVTTWQLQEGLDPQHEAENFAAEAKRQGELGAGGSDQQGGGDNPPPGPGGGIFESKDASGHEHDSANGQFTSSGGGGGAADKDGKDQGGAAKKSARDEWFGRQEERQRKKQAATDARRHQSLESPTVFANWHEDLTDEGIKTQLDADLKSYDSHAATVRGKLAKAGASEKELAEYDRRISKNRADIAKKADKVRKARGRLHDAQMALAEHNARRAELEAAEPDEPEEVEPPEEPEEEEEPDEPDEPPMPDDVNGETMAQAPDRSQYSADEDGEVEYQADLKDWNDFEAEHAQWKQKHAEWQQEVKAVQTRNEKAKAAHEKAVEKAERENDKAQSAYEKAHDAWEAKLEKHDDKAGELDDAAVEASMAFDQVAGDYEEEFNDSVAHNGEHVSDVEDSIHERLDDEDDADEEPEEEDDEEEERESRRRRRKPIREEGEPPFPGAVFDKSKHRWVKGTTDASTSPGNGRTGAPPAELHPDDARDITSGIDRDLAELPEDDRPPAGVVEKAKDVALTAAAKAYVWAVQFTNSKWMGRIAGVLEDVFDMPSDMAKLGYNPNTSSGTANPKVADFVSANLQDAIGIGVSGHLVASIASKVLVKAGAWVAGKVRGKSESVEDLDSAVEAWADMIAQLFAHLMKEMGVEGDAPSAEVVAKNIRELLKGKV